VNPEGSIVAVAEGEGALTVDLDREPFLEKRRPTPFLRNRRSHIYGTIARELDVRRGSWGEHACCDVLIKPETGRRLDHEDHWS
jgi:hypothetical protein